MFISQCYWKYVEVNFKPIPDDFTEEDKLDNLMFVKSVKTCKEFGLTVEETAEKLKCDAEDVAKIYEFIDLELFDWTKIYEGPVGWK